jgi:hypothetical protein
MSPEQAEGKFDELDAASDQFSLAAIVYEMLTGRPAFGGTTLASVAYQIVHAKAPSIQDFRPELPAELDQVLSRALAKNKKDRFPSVSEFALHFRWTATLPANARGAAEKPAAAIPLATDAEETTAVSALPSGMAEVLRQTSGLSAHPAAPVPALAARPAERAADAVHSDPTVVSTSPFAADDPSVVNGGPFSVQEQLARRRQRRAGPGSGLAVAGVVIAAVAIGLVVRGRIRLPDAVVTAPATPAPPVPTPAVLPAPAPAATPPAPAPAATAAVRETGGPADEATAPAGETTDDRKPRARGHERASAAAKGAGGGETDAPALTGGAATCRITVGSYPWADLWVDGANTGLQTPVVNLPLACGIHRLELRRRDLKVDQMEKVTLEEGHEFRRQYELEGASVDE